MVLSGADVPLKLPQRWEIEAEDIREEEWVCDILHVSYPPLNSA